MSTQLNKDQKSMLAGFIELKNFENQGFYEVNKGSAGLEYHQYLPSFDLSCSIWIDAAQLSCNEDLKIWCASEDDYVEFDNLEKMSSEYYIDQLGHDFSEKELSDIATMYQEEVKRLSTIIAEYSYGYEEDEEDD